MNYIAEIKAFYDRLELNPLPSQAISLWNALMHIANKTCWQQEFTVAVSVLMQKSGLNAQAVKRARNRLEQEGLITWRSRGGNLSASYHMNSLVVQNDTKNVPQCEPQSVPQSVPQCEPQSVPINKHIHKLKQNNRPPISPAESIQQFLSAYPRSGNRHLTEIAFIDCLMTGQVTEEQLVSSAINYADRCHRLKTDKQYMKLPENFLGDMEYLQYLPGVYEPPDIKDSNKFNQFGQNSYDFDALEKEILDN